MPSAHYKSILAEKDETYISAASDINKSFARYESFELSEKTPGLFSSEKVSKGVDSKVCRHANALKILNSAIRFLHSETSMDAQKACARKSTNSDRHEDEAHLYAVRQDQATEHTVANLGPSDQGIWSQP